MPAKELPMWLQRLVAWPLLAGIAVTATVVWLAGLALVGAIAWWVLEKLALIVGGV